MTTKRSTMFAIPFWTLALLVSAIGLLVSVNSLRFARAVDRDARQLLVATPAVPMAARPPSAALPAPVQRYLHLVGAAEGPLIKGARVVHGGSMTLAPGAASLPVRGRQFFATDPPGFVWWGRVRLAPGVWIDARDKVVAGVGGMKVMVESTKTLQDDSDPALDQGALVRLLGELTWMPTALRDPRYVRWEAIDDRQARAHLTVNGRRVSAEFHFGPDGLPQRFTAERHRDMGPGQPAVVAPFVGTSSDWRPVQGPRGTLLLPFRMEGAWVIDGAPFTFARFEVERVELDPAGAS